MKEEEYININTYNKSFLPGMRSQLLHNFVIENEDQKKKEKHQKAKETKGVKT